MNKQALLKLFEAYGDVNAANIMTDPTTGRSRGYAFIEMTDIQEANDAISALDGSSFDGRALLVTRVIPALPQSFKNPSIQ